MVKKIQMLFLSRKFNVYKHCDYGNIFWNYSSACRHSIRQILVENLCNIQLLFCMFLRYFVLCFSGFSFKQVVVYWSFSMHVLQPQINSKVSMTHSGDDRIWKPSFFTFTDFVLLFFFYYFKMLNYFFFIL